MLSTIAWNSSTVGKKVKKNQQERQTEGESREGKGNRAWRHAFDVTDTPTSHWHFNKSLLTCQKRSIWTFLPLNASESQEGEGNCWEMQPEQCPYCKKCLNLPGTKRMPAVFVFNRLKTSLSWSPFNMQRKLFWAIPLCCARQVVRRLHLFTKLLGWCNEPLKTSVGGHQALWCSVLKKVL